MDLLGVVPASRVAMDTSSLLIAFGLPLTFKAPAPKLIISDEFNHHHHHHHYQQHHHPQPLIIKKYYWHCQ